MSACAEFPSDAIIVNHINEILSSGDLSQMTTKSLRKKVEETLNCDLKAKKDLIQETLQRFIETTIEKEAESKSEKPLADQVDEVVESEDETRKSKGKKKGGGFQQSVTLSSSLAAFMGQETAPRTEVTKKVWSYIKENNLQDPKNKRNIICDETLNSLFPKRKSIDMFRMTAELSKLMYKTSTKKSKSNEDEEDGEEEAEEEAREEEEEETISKKRKSSTKAPKKEEKKEKSKKAKKEEEEEEEEDEDSEEEEEKKEEEKKSNKKSRSSSKKSTSSKNSSKEKEKKKGGGGLSKLIPLSDKLSNFLGVAEESRPQVVSKLWAYIKENNLQNPSNKREINCDTALKELFGVKMVTMFSMNKYLSDHFHPTK